MKTEYEPTLNTAHRTWPKALFFLLWIWYLRQRKRSHTKTDMLFWSTYFLVTTRPFYVCFFVVVFVAVLTALRFPWHAHTEEPFCLSVAFALGWFYGWQGFYRERYNIWVFISTIQWPTLQRCSREAARGLLQVHLYEALIRLSCWKYKISEGKTC